MYLKPQNPIPKALLSIGILVITVCFFLPWVKFWGTKWSAFRILTWSKKGFRGGITWEEAQWQYYVYIVLIVALAISGKIGLAKTRLVVSAISALTIVWLVVLIIYPSLVNNSVTLMVGAIGTLVGLTLCLTAGALSSRLD